MTEVAGAALGAVLAEITREILEKVKRGEKLTTEELLVLLLDLNYRQTLEFRREVLELYQQLSSRMARLEDKIEDLRKEMLQLYQRLDRKVEEVRRETSQRLDTLYQLLSKMVAQRKG